jgi:single-strand DNA-binding protein
MPALNKVMLIGNLTRDPQTKQLPSNTSLVEFGLAISRRFKTQTGEEREEVCFVDCTAFGKQADVIAQYCSKGKAIFIEGRLKYDTWDDKSGGGKRSKLSIVVENFQFLGSAHGEGGHATHRPQQQAIFDRPAKAEATRAAELAPAKPRGRSKTPLAAAAKFNEADIPF